MVKICVTKTSDRFFKYIQEYNSLEDCVNELLDARQSANNQPELVVSRPNKWNSEEEQECQYVVEIYDTWRE